MKQTNGKRFALSLTLIAAMAGQALAAKADGAPMTPDKPSISAEQLTVLIAKRRTQQIQRLRAYRLRGIFPRNTYSSKIRRVLVDANGTFCAVANLISLDGQGALVNKTAKTNRFVMFANLKAGPLHDWIFTSGFTQEELAAIQLPDRPMRPKISWRAMEQRRLRAHLLAMETKLIKDTKASIKRMVERLNKRPKLAGVLLRMAARG
jgi:hypothetical protein